MRYLSTRHIRLQTPKGVVDIAPETVFTLSNPSPLKELIDDGTVRPIKDILIDKYGDFCKWLESSPVNFEKIGRELPDLAAAIEKSLRRVETLIDDDNFAEFSAEIDKLKSDCLQAVVLCRPDAVAVKIYSEILQSYLWVVADTHNKRRLQGMGIADAIYTQGEIRALSELTDPQALKSINTAKEIFPDSHIKSTGNSPVKRHRS